MSMFDLNNEEQQREFGSLVPEDSIVLMRTALVAAPSGKEGPHPCVMKDKNGVLRLCISFESLNTGGVSFTDYIPLPLGAQASGLSTGYEKSCRIGGAQLRALIESARGVDPKDESPNAQQARNLSGPDDFDSLTAPVKLKVEKDKYEGRMYLKNRMKSFVTPDKQEYAQVMGGQDVITDKPFPQVDDEQQTGGGAGQQQQTWGAGQSTAQNQSTGAGQQQQSWGQQNQSTSQQGGASVESASGASVAAASGAEAAPQQQNGLPGWGQ